MFLTRVAALSSKTSCIFPPRYFADSNRFRISRFFCSLESVLDIIDRSTEHCPVETQKFKSVNHGLSDQYLSHGVWRLKPSFRGCQFFLFHNHWNDILVFNFCRYTYLWYWRLMVEWSGFVWHVTPKSETSASVSRPRSGNTITMTIHLTNVSD